MKKVFLFLFLLCLCSSSDIVAENALRIELAYAGNYKGEIGAPSALGVIATGYLGLNYFDFAKAGEIEWWVDMIEGSPSLVFIRAYFPNKSGVLLLISEPCVFIISIRCEGVVANLTITAKKNPPSLPNIISIEAIPDSVSVLPLHTTEVVILGRDADGNMLDLSDRFSGIKGQSSDETVAIVSSLSKGRAVIYAKSPGACSIKIVLPGFETTLKVVSPVVAKIEASDFDGNGVVDFPDFLMFAQAFGTAWGEKFYNAKFDLVPDGKINFADFLTFAAAFGKKSG